MWIPPANTTCTTYTTCHARLTNNQSGHTNNHVPNTPTCTSRREELLKELHRHASASTCFCIDMLLHRHASASTCFCIDMLLHRHASASTSGTDSLEFVKQVT
jgi:hypothetical protein